MHAVTYGEKYRAFYRCKASVDELFMNEIFGLVVYKLLIDQLIEKFGHPKELAILMEKEELNREIS